MATTTILGQAPTTLSVPRKATIDGDIEFAGDVVIDGIVNGDVHCTSLTIKERGQVDGTIVAEFVTVMGEVNGSIYANNIVLRTACAVAGDMYHQTLQLEDGCYFEGKSRRHKSPLSLAS
ncbi:MAG: polymer-forming cytoskeletal protein [Hyphomicrobium sp.]